MKRNFYTELATVILYHWDEYAYILDPAVT